MAIWGKTKMMHKITIFLILALGSALPLIADEAGDHFQAGLSHYNATPPESAAAAVEFSRAAELGHAGAKTHLGLMLLNGQGLPQNYAKAQQLIEQAARAGDAQAQFTLGQLYRNGQIMRMNKSSAVTWLTRAAGQGFAPAQAALAEMYSTGQEISIDYVQAHMWFNILAGSGNKEAASRRAQLEIYLTPSQISRAQKLEATFKPTPAKPN